jgi:hypothetical protein
MYVTDCTQLPDALCDKLYGSIKCNRMLRFIYCRHKPKVHRINGVCFRMSSYPHRIQQFFLVFCTHRKSQYPFSPNKRGKIFLEKSKKFSTPPKIIYVDRPIYNRRELQSIFPHIWGQFIEEVFHKIPALPDITFRKQKVPISKQFQYRVHSPFSPLPYPLSMVLYRIFEEQMRNRWFAERFCFLRHYVNGNKPLRAKSKVVSR